MESFSIREAAEQCGVSHQLVRKRVDRGTIETYKRDGVRRITRAELERAGLWPGFENTARAEADRLRAELAAAQAELASLRQLPMDVEAERKARELAEQAMHEARAESQQARAERETLQGQLREIEQAHIEASSTLDELREGGFIRRRRVLRQLRARAQT